MNSQFVIYIKSLFNYNFITYIFIFRLTQQNLAIHHVHQDEKNSKQMIKKLSVVLSSRENDCVSWINLGFNETVPCFVNIVKPKLYAQNIHMVAYEWYTHPTERSWEALSDKHKSENKHYYKVHITAVKIIYLFVGEYPHLPLLRT